MMRAGYFYGVLDYKTDVIPTLGVSKSAPHIPAILEISKRIDAELHPIRGYFKRRAQF